MRRPDAVLHLVGDVDEDMYFSFLLDMKEALVKKQSVEIALNSAGGSATDGLAIASLIRKHPYSVSVHGTGLIASAATIILVSGHKGLRSMDSTAWFMVHEDSEKITGRVSELEARVETLRRIENQWCWLFAQHTKATAKEWKKINAKEQYFNAKEALQLGVIDYIVDDTVKGK